MTPKVASRKRREYASGDEVRVPRFGVGKVRGSAGDEVTVEFPSGEARTFLRSYVRRAARPARRVGSVARPIEVEDGHPA